MNNKLKSGYLSKITGVEKVDDTTVDFQVADGAAYFTLGNSAVFVRRIPPHLGEFEDPPGLPPGEVTLSSAAPLVSGSRWMRRRRPCTTRRLGRPTWDAP